jgi:CheY-like chemotaxis protein
VANAVDIIRRQVEHLVAMVDDLLDVSRVARGKITLRREPIDLAALVQEAVADRRDDCEDAGLRLHQRYPEGLLVVEGDRTRLVQVVDNLLTNAIKFTDPGGEVTVALEAEGDMVAMIVCDTGVGVAPEDAAHLFEPFRQADDSLDRSKGGLGLGLSLVKGLVELHGGQVRLHSDGPGRGSEFRILLPASQGRPMVEPAEAAASVRPMRVLIIEDNRDTADTMKDVLELAGHDVSVAYDGRDGLAQARDRQPEVILCDIGLPGKLKGYDVAREVRATTELNGVRMIALTGYGQPEDRARSREAGFDAHLTKPVDIAELERIVPRPGHNAPSRRGSIADRCVAAPRKGPTLPSSPRLALGAPPRRRRITMPWSRH